MARGANPYGGQYSPARMSLTRGEIVKGLKGIKVKAPNRAQSETAYKSALPKEQESGSN